MSRWRLIPVLVLLLTAMACERYGNDLSLTAGPFGRQPDRKVMLLYEAGFNSLSGDLAGNIETLKRGYLPGDGPDDDILLVFSHLKKRTYAEATSPMMTRLYRSHGELMVDTLKVWPAGTSVANAAMVTEVFDWVKEAFPARSYGAVMSSHATGWLPEGYFSNPLAYEDGRRGGNSVHWAPSPYRTFGQGYINSGEDSEEIEIHDLAKAIPYHLDYILFDACLMATVEVAWELRNVCDYLAVSACEIPAAGFDYSSLTEYLLKPERPDLQSVCVAYFNRYKDDSTYGATICMVDCNALDPLAEECRTLFGQYRSGIRNLDGRNVQVYDRLMGSKDFYAFFDLKDMVREAGASAADLQRLQEALDQALVYEAHSAKFISIKLERCCGLAVYLPSRPDQRLEPWHGTAFLDNFYRQYVSWNEATMLVE